MASKLLVLLQFTAIAALLWPWGAAAWNPWAWLPIALASGLAAWAIASNPPTNFSIFPEPRANAQLITTGAYSRLRHPMYAALGLYALGCAIGWNTPWHWLSGLALAAVLDVKSRREERFLHALFPGYAAYAARTPRFLPRLRSVAR